MCVILRLVSKFIKYSNAKRDGRVGLKFARRQHRHERLRESEHELLRAKPVPEPCFEQQQQ